MSDDPAKHVYMKKVEILAERGFKPAGVLLIDASGRIAGVTFGGKVVWWPPADDDEPET